MICKEGLKLCRKVPQCKYDRCGTCRQVSTDSNVTRREKKSSYTLQNPNHVPVIVFHVDGGVVCDEENCKKCDYIYDITAPNASIVIFIELKGRHYDDALEQIENSVRLFKDVFSSSKLYARIVHTKVPDINNNPRSIKTIKFLKEQKITFNKGKVTMEETLKDLL